ncbi:MAG: DNA methyltransferase, partial [Candidatus Thorarchaeota archaeon]
MDSSSSESVEHNITESEGGFLEIEGDIHPSYTIPESAKILIISRDQTFLTHGVHKFPAKFFPELPRYLIKRYSEPNQTVLDPMCGSGTVILEAMLASRTAIGIDIDPMARLITKVKTTPLDFEILTSAKEELIALLYRRYKAMQRIRPIPEFNYRDTWFKDFVLEELGILYECIHDLRYFKMDGKFKKDITDFFSIVFSSIVRDVSNADPHCTRTVIRKNLVKKIALGDVIRRFHDALSKQVRAMHDLSEACASREIGRVRLPRSTATQTGLDDESVDLVVTSPPYINAVDYPRTHQLEMYWLGLIEEGPLSNMKRRYIGTETVYKEEYSNLRTTGLQTLDPVLTKIFSRDPRRSFIVFKFFEDMK